MLRQLGLQVTQVVNQRFGYGIRSESGANFLVAIAIRRWSLKLIGGSKFHTSSVK
jgi:hypothetical protein